MARNVTRRVGSFVAAVALAAAAFGPTANAAERNIDYVNLGDSYSAGFGTGGIASTGGCFQGSGADHVSKLDAKKGVDLKLDLACGGFTTSDIAFYSQVVAAGALSQAEVVTITLGGNDLPWKELVQACAMGSPEQCAWAFGSAQTALGSVGANVYSTLSTIRSLTNARIVVLGYPQLFDGVYPNPYLSPGQIAGMRQLTTGLNAQIAGATAPITNASFVDVNSWFGGHGVDSPDPWIYFNPTNLDDPNNLHPTSEGYLNAYYPATMSAISFGLLGR
ncbi:lysophospholipase L1-like esterase [Neomicrococcus aestuarii]|uniref:Lysophospholipase L1-like esterase n=1 Tax=Neomicrococcus aestuarii TaxID=556325 RepID=A0A7W8WZG8_9MICC|nr:SGNH/GDSL hydrolase family protein [Neomicrococcus aestuarii]MBB5513366.1 lysophospholipase L1-like esterase [Neomicrococcus aestuarii]